MPEPKDFEAALKSEMHAAHAPAASDAPPAADPALAAESTSAAPAPEPDPEPESTSVADPAVTTPSDTAGSPPPDQPQPAVDPTSDDEYQKLLARYDGDPKRAAREFFALESRHAALVREQKAAAKATPPPATATPAVPSQPLQPAVVGTQPAAAKPVPPAAATAEVPADYQAREEEFVKTDVECRTLTTQFNQIVLKAQEIAVLDQDRVPVGGRLAEVNTEIAELERILRPPAESLKRYGLDIPTLDPVQLADAKVALQGLELERIKLEAQFGRLEGQLDALASRHRKRTDAFRAHHEQRAEQQRVEAEQDAVVNDFAVSFEKQWTNALPNALKSNSVPDNLKARYTKAIVTAAKAHTGAIANEDLPAFMDGVIKEEKAKGDEYHRAQSADYAKGKIADVQRMTPAPPGKAAVATPAKTEIGSYEDRLLAETRARHRSVRA